MCYIIILYLLDTGIRRGFSQHYSVVFYFWIYETGELVEFFAQIMTVKTEKKINIGQNETSDSS